MFIESYIALVLLGLGLIVGIVVKADQAYQRARRAQRLSDRGL